MDIVTEELDLAGRCVFLADSGDHVVVFELILDEHCCLLDVTNHGVYRFELHDVDLLSGRNSYHRILFADFHQEVTEYMDKGGAQIITEESEAHTTNMTADVKMITHKMFKTLQSKYQLQLRRIGVKF
jgi:hypothetical protein